MEAMLMQNLGGQTKSIMVFLKAVYCVCVRSQCTFLPNSKLDQTAMSPLIHCF